jgi:choline dehydrogenase-like flavoprotein
VSGSITNLSTLTQPPDVTVEACVVGSGAAGATTAWNLARAGKDVLVLEEGGDFTGLQLTQRDGEMYDQLYMDRGARATTDLSIMVLQGRVLGGGGVINASDVVPISDAVLDHWGRRYGLTSFSPHALAPFKARALENLAANLPREDQVNRNNRLLQQGSSALGWRGEFMKHNRVGCVGAGTCLIGCPANAKRNPRFVAIPASVDAGARYFTRARAVRIDDATAEMKTLTVRALDARGHREGPAFKVKARVVVLAANALASAQLLLRSGIGNQHVGRHISLQPQLPVAASFPEEVRFFRGIPQSFAVTEFEELEHAEHGWWGFRLESMAGTPGIVSSLLPYVGAAGKQLMQLYPHLGAVLCLAPDAASGHLTVETNGRLRIHYQLDEEQKARFRAAAKAAARAFLAAGATQVVVPCIPPVIIRSQRDLALVDDLPFLAATVPFLSAHQQGGIRFSPSEADGAASPEGAVHGARNVYAFDSAGYPSSSSSHTMAPIMTTAHFLSEQLLARWPG